MSPWDPYRLLSRAAITRYLGGISLAEVSTGVADTTLSRIEKTPDEIPEKYAAIYQNLLKRWPEARVRGGPVSCVKILRVATEAPRGNGPYRIRTVLFAGGWLSKELAGLLRKDGKDVAVWIRGGFPTLHARTLGKATGLPEETFVVGGCFSSASLARLLEEP